MKLKKLAIFLLTFLTLVSSVFCISCNTEQNPKETISNDWFLQKFNNKLEFESFDFMIETSNNDKALNSYYFIFDTTKHDVYDNPIYKPQYCFYYNALNGIYENTAFFIYSSNVCDGSLNFDFPQLVGGLPSAFGYYYFAYETSDTQTPLTFKFYNVETSANQATKKYDKAMFVYQNENLVGVLNYYLNPAFDTQYDKNPDEYIENFFKQNLIILGDLKHET